MKKKVQCIIVDDDPYSINILKEYIESYPLLELQNTYTNSNEALSAIHTTGTELLFLDIDMPNISGLTIAENIQKQAIPIIFTTAYPEYAVQAFDLRIKHYLLKPIEFVKFIDAVNTVLNETNLIATSITFDEQAFYIRCGERGKLIKVYTNDIIYINSLGNYLQINTVEKTYTVYLTIKEMTEMVSIYPNFFRVHKFHIINANHIWKIEGNTVYFVKNNVTMSPIYNLKFMNYLKTKILTSKRN